MRVSTLSERWCGVFLLLIAGTVGCAQPGSGGAAALTAPTALGSANAAPGASYDGSGSWHFRLQITTKDGVDFGDEGDLTLTQDLDGNLHAIILDGPDDPRPTVITLIRRGLGPKLAYQMSTFEPHTLCNEEASGLALIDTATNTLQAKLSGTLQGCEKANWEINGTKN